ncbi:UbiA family prenyltransferase [Tumebacillus permanentifrigoris]|uniref:4-hydroxybenzoate polyprenyltransferase n=1 Tax=Tumebacillus permanentifrigoris TaxID=378543 RepID=A0A316DDX3_9BACL|nr:UbiA family prenyltransferase [Tumebacillus permanentifrigoris]PWK13857.1 4-hydroxybenzoate polyprenyltransferase [Tumebacillus permanentifrigoris]
MKQSHELPFLVRLYCLLSLSRLRTGFPSALSFVVGWMGTNTASPFHSSILAHPFLFALGWLLSFFSGTVVNLGNTVSDLREDKVNLPHRVKIARIYGLRRLLRVNNWMSLLMIVLACLTLNLAFSLFMILAVWLMNQYSFPPCRFKRHPFLSLINFSCAISFPFGYAYLMQTGGSVAPSNEWIWLCLLCTIFFGLFGTAKNLQDYDGDKAAGIRTTATMFRTKKAAVLFVAVCITSTPLLFILPILLGAFPPTVWIVPLWSVFICPMMMLKYKHRHNPAMLKTAQSIFFLYPVFFMASLGLILDPSWTMFCAIGVHACAFLLFERLGLDARMPRSYRNVMRLLDESTSNAQGPAIFK